MVEFFCSKYTEHRLSRAIKWPNMGPPKVHDLVSNIYSFQPGLSNTHAKNVQDSPNIGAIPKLMLLYLI